MTHEMREALIEQFQEANADYEAERIALGWTPEGGWPVPSGPRDTRAATRASKRPAGLYSEIKDIEAAMKDDDL